MRPVVTSKGAVPHLAGGLPGGTLGRAGFAPWRQRATVLVLALLVALALGLAVGCSGGSASDVVSPQTPPVAEQGGASSQGGVLPGTHPNQPSQPGNSLISTITARVTGVIDGDTFRARLAGGREEKVRLTGVDTPESTKEVEPYGKEAAAYTRKRLSGRTVYLELDVGERDKYGRLLAYVWLSPPGSGSEAEVRAKMYNAELLLAGMAQVMTVPPNVKYSEVFVKLQREARDASRGLWAAGAATSASGGAAGGGASSGAGVAKYVGNASSKKFHRPDCEWAAKIAPRNRVEFASREKAIAAGYVPCKVCRP